MNWEKTRDNHIRSRKHEIITHNKINDYEISELLATTRNYELIDSHTGIELK